MYYGKSEHNVMAIHKWKSRIDSRSCGNANHLIIIMNDIFIALF